MVLNWEAEQRANTSLVMTLGVCTMGQNIRGRASVNCWHRILKYLRGLTWLILGSCCNGPVKMASQSLDASTDEGCASFDVFLADRFRGVAGPHLVGSPVRNSPPGNRVFGKALSAGALTHTEFFLAWTSAVCPGSPTKDPFRDTEGSPNTREFTGNHSTQWR